MPNEVDRATWPGRGKLRDIRSSSHLSSAEWERFPLKGLENLFAIGGWLTSLLSLCSALPPQAFAVARRLVSKVTNADRPHWILQRELRKKRGGKFSYCVFSVP